MDPFDAYAQRYDAWYDSEYGREVFEREVECLGALPGEFSPGLEIGGGSGRFSSALGIKYNLDPSLKPLKIARERGTVAVRATGEALPFSRGSFELVALIFTLCFVKSPQAVLTEAARVLRPRGKLLLGVIPKGNPLAEYYRKKAEKGHIFYSFAIFYSEREIEAILEKNFRVLRRKETLLPGRGGLPQGKFLCLLLEKRE